MSIETDEKLAIEYLGCRAIEIDGKVTFEYVERGSDRETLCLTALCRLLRGREPLSLGLRYRLATLFDADSGLDLEVRRLVLVRRGGGGRNRPSDAQMVMIAGDIAAATKDGPGFFESAVAAATERYGVSRSTVTKAWKAHRAGYKKQR